MMYVVNLMKNRYLGLCENVVTSFKQRNWPFIKIDKMGILVWE